MAAATKQQSLPLAAESTTAPAPSDASLVESARSGEEWAREALFRRHVRLAFGLAFRLLPRDVDADDIVQDSFLYAFGHLQTLANPQAFQAWLSSIVVRTAGKRLRRRRLQQRLGLLNHEPVDADRIVSSIAPPDVVAELRAVYSRLDRLPAEERIALVLRRVERLEIPEIAEKMRLSLSTVKRRLKAAEARLETELRS